MLVVTPLLLLRKLLYNPQRLARSNGYTLAKAWNVERTQKETVHSGALARITEFNEVDVTALACSTPPESFGQWTVELLSDQMIQLDHTKGISERSIAAYKKK